ncbi:MAG: protein-disulfide reductase DsbD family protein [Candidatus Bruticola sp.]
MNALIIANKARRLLWIVPILWLLVNIINYEAQAWPGNPSSSANKLHSKVKLIFSTHKLQPNQEFYAGVFFDVPAGSHIGWVNGGENGLPTSVKWNLPDGFILRQTLWPAPRLLNFMGEKVWGCEGQVLIIGHFQAPPQLVPGRKFPIGAEVSWLDCNEKGCQPGSQNLSAFLEFGAEASQEVSSVEAKLLAKELSKQIPANLVSGQAWKEPGQLHLQFKWKSSAQVQEGTIWNFYPFQGSEFDLNQKPVGRWITADTFRLDIPLRSEPSARSSLPLQELSNKVEGILAEQSSGRYVGLNLNIDSQAPAEADVESAASKIGRISDVAVAPLNFTNFVVYTMSAFVGGIILNFMPCVFPVLSLKVFNFIEQAGQGENRRAHSLKAALWFSVGILLSFWLVAAVIIILKLGGQELGWGFQMQYPAFVAFLTLLFFVIALNLWGVFEFGLGFTRLGNLEKNEPKVVNSILSGALTVIAAAPCTAPFMGSALGFSFASPIYVSAVIFTALAAGMALPYAILASWPSLIERLPRPGRWMDSLKQLLAFPLAFTCIYFLWIFAGQAGRSGAALLAAALVWAALSAWIYGRFIVSSPRLAVAFSSAATLLALLTAGLACWQKEAAAAVADSAYGAEAVWSERAVAEALARKQPVFIDFGADWCLTCQFNEKNVLSSHEVRRLFEAKKVLFLKADWTNRNDEITKALRQYGRTGVPLYVYYNPNRQDEPIILPEILTLDILQSHIK